MKWFRWNFKLVVENVIWHKLSTIHLLKVDFYSTKTKYSKLHNTQDTVVLYS